MDQNHHLHLHQQHQHQHQASQFFVQVDCMQQAAEYQRQAHKPAKKKKTRTMFSNYQLSMLETTFQQSPYPDAYTRRDLAQRLALDESRVQVWFQNRRAKWRKKAAVGAQSSAPAPVASQSGLR